MQFLLLTGPASGWEDRIIILAIALGVGGVLAIITILMRFSLNEVNAPDLGKRSDLVETMRQMKADGHDYEARLSYLRAEGYRKDVAIGMLAETERKIEN